MNKAIQMYPKQAAKMQFHHAKTEKEISSTSTTKITKSKHH
jgi:hypothetical protein